MSLYSLLVCQPDLYFFQKILDHPYFFWTIYHIWNPLVQNVTVETIPKLEVARVTWKENWRTEVIQLPLVIVDSSVILKMSTITIESTIPREIKAKTSNLSTEHISYNEKLHYFEMLYYHLEENCDLNCICRTIFNMIFLLVIRFVESFRVCERQL